MEGIAYIVAVNDQQRIRISKLLSLDVEDLSRLLEQLQDQSQAPSAINTLVRQLDQKAIQNAAEQSWKAQAEEAKATLATEKINFEQRLQLSESRLNTYKTQLSGMRGKLDAATKEAQEAVAKATELEAKLSNQQSGSLHTHVELEALKSRIESLESEKRDHLSTLERKINEANQTNEDYQNLSNKYLAMKIEHAKSESELREAKAAEMTQKLQKQAIEQELEMMKQRMDWTNSELKAKSEELNTYRNDKATQILQLQGDLDKARLEASTATQSNTTLQHRVKELQGKLEEVAQKNKDLQDQSVVQEEQFRVEMETQRRLGELWERAASDTKGRIADLEDTLDEMQRTLSTKESDYRETMNEITEEKLQLQIRLEESTVEIEKLKEEQKRTDELLHKAGLIDTSGNSEFNLGRLGVLSPTAVIAARLQKNGLSLTQVYSRYMELQAEHAQLKLDNAQLNDTMNTIVKELSEGAPLIRDQQLEYQRLQKHTEELAAQLEAASQEKEQLAFGAREALAQLDGVVKERDTLHKENQDLDRQVQNLLWRLRAPNAPQSLAPASTNSVVTESTTETEKVFDDHFILFSNVQELQQQNKQLRQIARQFTLEREAAEGTEAQVKKKEEQDVIEEAERLIESMREEVGAKELQIATYKQELDMMRRIVKTSNIRNLSSTPGTPEGTAPSTPSQSGQPTGDVVINSEASEYAKLLADLQKTFDAYRSETTVDNRHLKDQLQQTQADCSDLRIQLARAKTEIEVMSERYQHVLDNSDHLSSELKELRKRCTSLQETATRHEIANQRLSSDLYAERDSAVRLTTEINNLKTEKVLWKSFETRLLEENQALVQEKGHLNQLLQTVQNMTNELEKGNEQTKRRLENSVTNKEQEVETLKEKLKEEVETSNRLRDRKEVETKEWQARIDTLQAEYQTSREALIAAKTSLEHTTAKVEDLTKQVKNREEQLANYQNKPTGVNSSEGTHEEQLQAQLVQLHNELARKQAELDAGREHLAQFQSISQTNEDRLAEITATFEEFKREHDRAIEDSTQAIKSLETKLANAEERAQSAASSLLDMQNKADQERSAWRKEKEEIEVKLRSLENIEIQMNAKEHRYRRDLHLQAQQTKEAHENYERELVNHARDIEALTQLKTQHQTQSLELGKYKAQSEGALASLKEAEASWESQKSTLQKTLAEVEKRCSELKEQNDKLHRHLEDVSAQALTIQQRANAPLSGAEGTDGMPSEGADGVTKSSPENQLAELRDVIRFVRREKEILECQHELNLQESRRLKQQLEQTNRSLDETRALLTEQRNKHQEIMVSKQQHEQLLEKINQMNLLRESNTTLRSENERLQRRVASLEGSQRALQMKLDPLNEQVRQMKADLEFSKEELKQVGEDRDRWRTRTVEIMAKHDRIDPTEFQELKDAVEKYKVELTEAGQKLTTLKAEHDALQAKYDETNTKIKLVSGHAMAWRKKHSDEAAKVEEMQRELATLRPKVSELEKSYQDSSNKASQVEDLQKSLEAALQAKEKLEAEIKGLKETMANMEKNYESLRVKATKTAQRNKLLSTTIRELTANPPSQNSENGAASADTQAAIDAAVKSRTEELEKKYAAQTATQATSPGSMTAAEVEARIEEEKQKVAAELAQKHKQHVETMEQIHKMRQELKVQTKEREIQNLKDLLAGAGVTVGTTGSNDTRPANASTEVQTRAPAPTGALSVSAPTFRPQAAATTPARPARPANPVRVVRTTPGAPGSPSEAGPAARNLSGAAPRPGHAATNAHGHHPRPAAGHSRLRPPLGARVAAAAATATGTSPAVQPSAVTATSTAAPASAQAVTPQTAATVTATSAPVPTSAPASTPASVQPSRLLIKRRREEELPGDLNHPQSTSPSLDATAVEGGSVTGSPSMGPTSVIVTPDSKTPPMVIKRQRQLPVVVSATTSTQETSTSVPAASETKSGTVTIQRRRVISTTDSTEAQPGSAPASTPDVTVTTTPPTSAAAEPTAKTSPHGQKRRLETTETVQESITIVSTPGPTDVEEDVSTPEPSHENMSMEVDDAPPVKRVRPSSTGGSSSVVITELPDEAPSSSNAQEELAAPEQFLDYEEGEMEDEAANANVDVATAETAGAEPAQKEEQQEEDHHTQEETVQQGSGADHEVEDELEGLDSTYETPGATDVIVFEDVEVQAPHAQDDEEVELELGLDEQREHEGEGDGSESAA